jgi:hypothetical protein
MSDWATHTDRILSVQQAAIVLSVGEGRIKQMCKTRQLRSRRLGGRVLMVDGVSVLSYVKTNNQQPPAAVQQLPWFTRLNKISTVKVPQ